MEGLKTFFTKIKFTFVSNVMWYRIFIIAGAAALIGALIILSDTVHFVNRSRLVEGFVSQFDTINSGDGGTSYTPVFKLTTSDGRQIRYIHHSSTAPPGWEIGERAMFLYDRADVSSVRMYNYFSVFSWSIVLASLGIMLLTFGGGYFWLRRYWR
ncbi:DUF3592 domain-containing protein [Niabella sp. 22666]|uniref:DUF3592 domain-containing protein n=1 Tax=Niabella sp. 22666 TaxID=3453954 RepID=UPI003F82F198